MAQQITPRTATGDDTLGSILKWGLLAVAVVTFGLFGWATRRTYQLAPPTPARFTAPGGATLMTAHDIEQGKAGFQRADLMDYGSLYGMGSYFGPDYTATVVIDEYSRKSAVWAAVAGSRLCARVQPLAVSETSSPAAIRARRVEMAWARGAGTETIGSVRLSPCSAWRMAVLTSNWRPADRAAKGSP